MQSMDLLLAHAIKWIDNIFALVNTYSKNYSRYIIYAVILFIGAKIFKFKFNFNTGLRGKK